MRVAGGCPRNGSRIVDTTVLSDIHRVFIANRLHSHGANGYTEKNPPCPFAMGRVAKKKREYKKVECQAPGCIKWAQHDGMKHRFCRLHGGGKPCAEPGCTSKAELAAPGKFCSVHGGGLRCKYGNGCNKHAAGGGLCAEHNRIARELVMRIRRNSGLRDKYLDEILEEQGGVCANPHKHCYDVVVGAASSRCPFGDRSLPRDMAQLDHKIPLFQDGTDDKHNLQVLCACCHQAKSGEEAREATMGL